MDVERELRPFRNLVYAAALFIACAVAILVAPANESPYMHTFFDAGIVVVSAVVALLLWDLGLRTDDFLTRLIAVAIGMNAVFELVHVLPALEVSRNAVDAARLAGLLRPVTWPPAAFILPIGLCAAYVLRRRGAIRATCAGNRTPDHRVRIALDLRSHPSLYRRPPGSESPGHRSRWCRCSRSSWAPSIGASARRSGSR